MPHSSLMLLLPMVLISLSYVVMSAEVVEGAGVETDSPALTTPPAAAVGLIPAC